MLNLTQLHEIAQRDRETFREMMRFEREQIEKLEQIKRETDRPAETVKAFVKASSYGDAVATIANLVNRSAWDGRISSANADWAKAYAQYDESIMVEKGLCTSIHMTHLDQIADAMRAYAPEDADTDGEEITEEEVLEAVEALDDAELVEAHNACCEADNNPDWMIYSMDEFEVVTECIDKYDLLRMAHYGTFNPNDDWFGFNGYGNLVSFGWEKHLVDRIDREEIAHAYIDNPDTFRYTALGEALAR